MTQSEINEAEWQDSGNWHWGIYNSPRDARILVPKRIKWTGWTFNFAHRGAYLLLLGLLLPALITLAAIVLTEAG